MSPLTKLLRRERPDWLLALEAFGFLCAAKALVIFVPFGRYARTLGRSEGETATTISPADRQVAVKISWAVQAVARLTCSPSAEVV